MTRSDHLQFYMISFGAIAVVWLIVMGIVF